MAEGPFIPLTVRPKVKAGDGPPKFALGNDTLYFDRLNNDLWIGGPNGPQVVGGPKLVADSLLMKERLTQFGVDLQTSTAFLQADYLERIRVVVDANSATAEKVETLEVQINTPDTGLNARLNTVETATANLQTGKANVSRVVTLEAKIDAPLTGLLARMTVQETATADLQAGKASSARVTTLEAQVQHGTTGLLARMTSQEAATVDLANNKASVTSVNTLTTRINDAEATLEQYGESIDGLTLRVGVRLDSNGHIVGWEAFNDGTTGTFTLTFDAFKLVDPAGGTPKTIIDYAGGVLSLNGDIRVNGQQLVPSTVTTDILADQTVSRVETVSLGSVLSGTNVFQTALTFSLTLTEAARVVVMLTGKHSYVGGGAQAWNAQVQHNGSLMSSAGGAGFGTDSFAASGAKALAAGSHVFTLRWLGETSTLKLAEANLVIMVLKK